MKDGENTTKEKAGVKPAFLDRLCVLSPFNQPGLKAACADMQPFITAIHLALYPLDIGFPNCVGSSIRMAYIVTEMNALATNFTFVRFFSCMNSLMNTKITFEGKAFVTFTTFVSFLSCMNYLMNDKTAF